MRAQYGKGAPHCWLMQQQELLLTQVVLLLKQVIKLILPVIGLALCRLLKSFSKSFSTLLIPFATSSSLWYSAEDCETAGAQLNAACSTLHTTLAAFRQCRKPFSQLAFKHACYTTTNTGTLT